MNENEKILADALDALLKGVSHYKDSEGNLLVNEVVNDAHKADKALIRLLMSDKVVRAHFFDKIDDAFVFRTTDFVFYLKDRMSLKYGFTLYGNKIGLMTGDKRLSESDEVVLAWPYKDGVLEGGMSKEDEGARDELFFNNILAKDEIDKLFAPKALAGWKRYTKDGAKEVGSLKRDENGTIRENLLIKGNNLLALHSLKEQFAGRVKLIYIDPPYYFSDTKSGDAFAYNTNYKLPSWLVFMKNRLSIARDLLAKEGSIFIQISDEGLGYLRCLLDEVFKPENFLNIISVQAKSVAGASGGGEDKKLKKNTEFIILYCKDYLSYSPNKVYREIPLKFLIEDKKREGKDYEYKQILLNSGKREAIAKIKTADSEEVVVYGHSGYEISTVKQEMTEKSLDVMGVYNQYYEKIFRTHDAQSSIRHKVVEATKKNGGLYSIEYYPRSGKNKGKLTTNYYFKNELVGFLTNTSVRKDGEIIKHREVGSLWDDIGWDGIASEGGVKLKAGKKPEKLLQRIIELSTDDNDLVMDFHLGSGTTCAVANKMGRQYIGIEQLNYGDNDSEVRLQNVIKGDQTGISKAEGWQGGGDFVYVELAKYNQEFMEQIGRAKSTDELREIWKKVRKVGFIDYKIKASQVSENITKDEFSKLPLEVQKRQLLGVLDVNQLYLPSSEMDDESFGLSSQDKALTKAFYKSTD